MSSAIAVILKGYPRLSETFIANEISALEHRGLDLRLYSLRHPTDPVLHPVHETIRAPVVYLPEYLHHEPMRVFRAWRHARSRVGYGRALKVWRKDLLRDRTINRIRRFGQALVLADELPSDVRWLHAHFLHTPSSVVRYCSILTGLPWSVSAHAKDVWTIADWEKREKISDCHWLVTCTRHNAEHLASLSDLPGRVTLLYHGLNSRTFAPQGNETWSRRTGDDPDDPVRLLSVGRAVGKKGYDVLLSALAQLPPDLHWRFTHIGGGPLRETLMEMARRLNLSQRIDWRGAQAQDTVLSAYRAADVFILACRITDDGDRDGLPNVLIEAQSQGLVCLSTDVSGIPELISHAETGLLAPPDEPAALARHLQDVICNAELRRKLGQAGQNRVFAAFNFDAGIDILADRFGKAGAHHPDGHVCASPSMRL